ncbi:MAG: zinc/manganese transport system substrate-binding protein [Myxococcota bacterium]|jgi:zinc/manganese transport system substrate-binding protein
MQSIRNSVLFCCLFWPLVGSATVGVVATTPSLGALVRAVGGEHVSVKTLAAPTSDPHFVDGRPSFVVALNRADLLVRVGLELETGWLPGLVAQARNSEILPSKAGDFDASTAAGPLLGVGASTDRRLGDVHGAGNPHYLFDPRMGVNVALALAARLSALDPEHKSSYERRASNFKRVMLRRIADWQSRLKPLAGKPIVTFHDSFGYVARWVGLTVTGHIEALPGVPPTAKHLAGLILKMRRLSVGVIVSEAWYDAETARVVASKTGAKLIRLPGDVGAPGIGSYPDLIEHIVQGLESAL